MNKNYNVVFLDDVFSFLLNTETILFLCSGPFLKTVFCCGLDLLQLLHFFIDV